MLLYFVNIRFDKGETMKCWLLTNSVENEFLGIFASVIKTVLRRSSLKDWNVICMSVFVYLLFLFDFRILKNVLFEIIRSIYIIICILRNGPNPKYDEIFSKDYVLYKYSKQCVFWKKTCLKQSFVKAFMLRNKDKDGVNNHWLHIHFIFL